MRGINRSFLIFSLLSGHIACSQKPIVAPKVTEPSPSEILKPYVAGTEAALASSTPWVAGTETALAPSSTPPALPTLTPLAMPFPTFTPFVLPKGTFSPIFYDFLLVGGFKTDQGWLSADQTAQFRGIPMTYDFYSSGGSMTVQASSLEYDFVCRDYTLQSSTVLPESMIGVARGWIKTQRGSTDLPPETYVRAVKEWFESQDNFPEEIRITRALQLDLEGDGVDEVLLSASYFKEKFAFLTENGDYSIVLMRKVMGEDVITIPLVNDYYVSSIPELEVSYPNIYTLADALDLNGDGTLEVIVDVDRWEGGGALVYRVDGQNVREVLRAICSAS